MTVPHHTPHHPPRERNAMDEILKEIDELMLIAYGIEISTGYKSNSCIVGPSGTHLDGPLTKRIASIGRKVNALGKVRTLVSDSSRPETHCPSTSDCQEILS